MEQPSPKHHPHDHEFKDEADLLKLTHALAAYRRLPDIDPLSPRLLLEFDEHYVASYPDTTTLIRAMYEIDEAESAVREIVGRYGLEGRLDIDYSTLWRNLTDLWDVAAHGPWFHVFTPGPSPSRRSTEHEDD